MLSWAALRMVWTEVLQSRRENAADRAAAACAYRELFATRAAEHAEFTTAMTERLAQARLSQRELEGQLAQQQGRTARAESVAAEARGRAGGAAQQRRCASPSSRGRARAARPWRSEARSVPGRPAAPTRSSSSPRGRRTSATRCAPLRPLPPPAGLIARPDPR